MVHIVFHIPLQISSHYTDSKMKFSLSIKSYVNVDANELLELPLTYFYIVKQI